MYQHARAIGDNSRRDFHPQVIDDRSCRDMLQQEHLKSQQAIDGNSRRAMLQQHDSIGDNRRIQIHENSRTTVLEIFALWRKLDSRMSRMRMFALRT